MKVLKPDADGGSILSARRRLDDLENELPEVFLLADGAGYQPLSDVAVEDENQSKLDTITLAGRAGKAGNGELRGGASRIGCAWITWSSEVLLIRSSCRRREG